jgi:PAS domain S-box-containing protein
MRNKLSHKELEQRVKALEKEVLNHKKAEQSLRTIKKKYQDLFENAPIAYFSISPDDGSILRVNSEATRLLGYKKKDLKQMKVFDLYADTQHGIPKAKQLFKRFQAGESIREEELQMKCRDGEAVWINLNVETVKDHDGRILESRSMVIDISKRKMAEEALRKSEKRYRLLVETMNDGLIVMDKKASLEYLNDKFCEMLGYQRDELLGRPIVDFLLEPNQTMFKKQFARRKKGEGTRYEMTFIRKDGREVPTIISGMPIFDDGKRFKGTFAVVTDITDRKKMETKLGTRATDLGELNIALKVLLKRRELDKTKLEEKVLINVNTMIMPYLEKLKMDRLNDIQRTYLDILEYNLNDIISPFASRLSFSYLKLTQKEIEVANLIKYGKTTKEIADFLNLSSRTIESHRKNIRKKLGIQNDKSNLRSYLSSLQ